MSEDELQRQKVCYEQNFAQFRSLNEQMNRVPTIAVTLTGGLWFGAALTKDMETTTRFALLIFAGLANVALGLSCLRIRDVMQSYLEKIRTFYEPGFASGRPERPTLGRFGGYSMIVTYTLLMGSAAVLSWMGAFSFYWPFPRFSAWWGVAIFAVLLLLAALVVLRRRDDSQ
jgi:hypothetical protein